MPGILREIASKALSPDAFKKLSGTKRFLQETYFQKKVPRYQVSCEEILKGLEAVGVVPGDNLIAHSSTDRLMTGSDKPKERVNMLPYSRRITDVLLDRIGPSGSLFMPTDSIKNIHSFLLEDRVFDWRRMPSRRGLVTEMFRRRRGTLRSTYPIYNLTGYGPLAETMISVERQDSPYAMDRDSIWYKLMQLDAKCLFIASGYPTNSAIHMPEYLHSAEYPRLVFYDRLAPIRCVNRNGDEYRQNCAIICPRWSDTVLEKFCGYLQDKYGVYRHFDFGHQKMICFSLKEQYDCLMKEMKAGVCWYDAAYWK